MKRFTSIVLSLFLVVFGLGFSQVAQAESLSYDRYAAVYDEPPQQDSLTKRALLHFPVYPFELVRWPVEKALLYIQKHRLDTKTIWIYNQMKNRGFTPYLNVVSLGSLSTGADLDLVRIARKKHVFPDLVLKGDVRWSLEKRFEVGGDIGFERIGGSGFSFVTETEYEVRHQEHFYGIGPDTSKGDGFVYGLETTVVKPTISYEWGPSLEADLSFAYMNVNTNGGKDGGRGQIGEDVFAAEFTPGLAGDSLIQVAAGITHDTRNHRENSTQGGLRSLMLGFTEGVSGSEARYITYKAELSHYFALWSEKRVFAFRILAEHNDEINDGIIPFHQMPKLGGYGTSPDLGYALRGFDRNRFTDESAILFNIEYRYNIWHYRHFKLDTVFFWDEGQVFDEFSNFQIKDFRESYGLGFRLNAANIPLLSVEWAHSDEGSNIYVKSSMPF